MVRLVAGLARAARDRVALMLHDPTDYSVPRRDDGKPRRQFVLRVERSVKREWRRLTGQFDAVIARMDAKDRDLQRWADDGGRA
jgi:hypothetical protein